MSSIRRHRLARQPRRTYPWFARPSARSTSGLVRLSTGEAMLYDPVPRVGCRPGQWRCATSVAAKVRLTRSDTADGIVDGRRKRGGANNVPAPRAPSACMRCGGTPGHATHSAVYSPSWTTGMDATRETILNSGTSLDEVAWCSCGVVSVVVAIVLGMERGLIEAQTRGQRLEEVIAVAIRLIAPSCGQLLTRYTRG